MLPFATERLRWEWTETDSKHREESRERSPSTVGRWEPDKEFVWERERKRIEHLVGQAINPSCHNAYPSQIDKGVRDNDADVDAGIARPVCRQHVAANMCRNECVWYFCYFLTDNSESDSDDYLVHKHNILKVWNVKRNWQFEWLDSSQSSVIYEAAIS